MRRLSLALMRRLAQRRGGLCLAVCYRNSRSRLRWRCRFGHEWNARAENVKRGSWCPFCAKRHPLTLQEMQSLARDRGGCCLSERYVNSQTKLQWRCANGHEWEAAPGLVKAGRWCPHCAHVARLSLHDMVTIAKNRGGHCLSEEYVNIGSLLSWKCERGHRWNASAASIRNGSWCPWCARNRRLELASMRRLARKRGGRCLSHTYVNNHTSLLWECKRGHRWKGVSSNVKTRGHKRGTWCLKCYGLRRRFRVRGSLDSMERLARKRGGHCLSEEYRNAKTKLLWQCSKGHRWSARPDSIRQGSWCPDCARNQRLTLEEFQELAARRGGQCLAGRYTNKSTPLRWRCAAGHEWSAQPGTIKQGGWCPKCVNVRKRSRWKTISKRARVGRARQNT